MRSVSKRERHRRDDACSPLIIIAEEHSPFLSAPPLVFFALCTGVPSDPDMSKQPLHESSPLTGTHAATDYSFGSMAKEIASLLSLTLLLSWGIFGASAPFLQSVRRRKTKASSLNLL